MGLFSNLGLNYFVYDIEKGFPFFDLWVDYLEFDAYRQNFD
jgi:hypothetical protein